MNYARTVQQILHPPRDPEPTPEGTKRFFDAIRHIGSDDPLTGPRWIIPGILLEDQTAMCPGPPGSGKSFAIIDWFARVALGLEFMGRPCLQGGAVYVTGEGQAGLAKRISAIANEFEITNQSPFLYVRRMPRFLDPQEISDFIAAVENRIADWTVPIRCIGFDTFNRALVGGSENEGKDVARLLDADNRIKFSCATMFAHHPGKAEGNDIRGHSSLLGDTDVTCIFSGKSGTRTIEVKKQKDEDDGALFGYSLRPVHLGMHKISGDPVTSCLVNWVDSETARGAKATSSRWPRSLTFLNDVIAAAVLEVSIDHRPYGDGPMVKAVPIEHVRALHRRRYVGNGDGDRAEAERKAFNRSLRAAPDARLVAGEMVGIRELIWAAR